MEVSEIINFAGVFIWLLVPFRQKGTEYFMFFFFLAINDPVRYLAYKMFHLQINALLFLFGLLVLGSLIKSKKYHVAIIALALLTCICTFNLSARDPIFQIGTLIINFTIAMQLIIILANHITNTGSVNIMLIVALFEIMTTVIKRLMLVSGVPTGRTSFELATISQLLFGILLLFINYNTFNIAIIKRTDENI